VRVVEPPALDPLHHARDRAVTRPPAEAPPRVLAGEDAALEVEAGAVGVAGGLVRHREPGLRRPAQAAAVADVAEVEAGLLGAPDHPLQRARVELVRTAAEVVEDAA